MVTEIGKLLRGIRIKTGDSLRDMAMKLNMSPAYLSSIENGKRNAQEDLCKAIYCAYDLTSMEKEKIKSSIYASTNNYRIDLASLNEKSRKILLSVTEGNLNEEVLTKLCEVVSNEENKENK